MFNQSFDVFDFPRILILMLLEILLSADNAIILAMLTHRLPLSQRTRALFIGLFSSFLLRGMGLLFISILITYFWIQLIGALYLLYLSAHYFLWKRKLPVPPKEETSGFWKTVFLLECFDLIFAIDSILAGVGLISSFSQGAGILNQKLWVVYVGTILGLVLVRFAAKLLSGLIERFPNLKRAGHLMIGWIGLHLCLHAIALKWGLPALLMHLLVPIYWIVLSLLFLSGFLRIRAL